MIGTGKGMARLPDSWKGTFEWKEMDITDRQQVLEVFEASRPDAVIHTAAMTQVDDCEKKKSPMQVGQYRCRFKFD